MVLTRRDFCKTGIAVLPAVGLMPARILRAAPEKPDSVFGGVQIGVIAPFSFRGMPDDAASVLKDLVTDDLSGLEMQHYCAERFAGAPASPGRGMLMRGMMARGGGERGGTPGRAGRGVRRPPLTPEQKAAQAEAAERLKNWRLSVSMDKFKRLRQLYNDAGVTIYALKLAGRQFPVPMSQEECAYAFNMAEALGARCLQIEFPQGDSGVTQMLGAEGARRKMMVGYHEHLDASPTLWDGAMAQSKYNGINLDIGHWIAAGNSGPSLLEFIRKNHARITSLHLKDRTSKAHGGQARPWGHGETPLKQILQLMKARQYAFPGTIELDYAIPAGSTSLREVARCRRFCQNVLTA